ncbi:MAG: GNAT family N-acetyltransferase, partial [Chloroflexota bacterium]|nr:GNAT family N-acetyltransferase [Chloroflexota bacterium]
MTTSRRGGTVLPTADVVLRDGRSLRLRPIRPDDKQRWLDFFYRLSPRTRYLRFQYAKAHATEEEVAYYTEVTPPDRCAYVATSGDGDQERIVAIGRWDALPDGKSAEIAFAVEDRIQMRGIGTALLEQLAFAAMRYEYQRFVARVLEENTMMLDVFEQAGFPFTKRLDEGIYYYTFDLTQRAEFARRQVYREHVARSAGVRHIFYPRRVAVIGASRDPRSVGGAIFRNLLQGGYTGAVFPVNPKAPAIGGVLAYPSILDVPGDVDLAVIVVPAAAVHRVVEECEQKGVWGLVVISAGFGETGEEGRALEHALREEILSHGMRLVGPNCLGVINADPAVSMNATFAPVVPPPGRVSMGSQSGALGIALLEYAKSINLGLAQFVSIGNGLDITANDLLEFWEDDKNTDVILLYLESFGNARKFSRTARRISRRKPILVVKSGRSAAGARAASSHTGALAAADVAVDALFRQAGVIRVSTIEEMFSVAQVLEYQPLPKGNRVAIVTNAGGPGILATDACESWGLSVAPLSDATRQKLREFLPPQASVGNPVDMIASATPEHYRQTLSVVLEDPDVDAVILIYIPPVVTRPEEVAAAVREAVAAHQKEKPVVACFMMSRDSAPLDLSVAPNRYIPNFIFPEEAVQALGRAYSYTQYRAQPEGVIPSFPDLDKEKAKAFLRSSVDVTDEGAWLLPEVAMGLLKMYGIPAVEMVAATSAEEAGQAAAKLGFPVAMKVRSSTIVHKTDVGGIALNLRSTEDVERA